MEMLMKKIRFIFALWIAKFTLIIGKILKKQGSMISGKVAVAIQKDFVRYFSNIDLDKTIFVTGTNGKSTTTNLVAHTIKSARKTCCYKFWRCQYDEPELLQH